MVTRLDRLARSTRDLSNTLDTISKAGAGFKSLADTWADTTTPHGRLMLTVLGGLAEFERSLILARTSEGRARAAARGVHMGRPSALNRDQQREARARREASLRAQPLGPYDLSSQSSKGGRSSIQPSRSHRGRERGHGRHHSDRHHLSGRGQLTLTGRRHLS
jgi:DNA invertase Pin-like site-specific DNA recombinase